LSNFIVIIEFTMKMVIENEELNLIILSQFYSIIACYVRLYIRFSNGVNWFVVIVNIWEVLPNCF
jgi:hypothetical protein